MIRRRGNSLGTMQQKNEIKSSLSITWCDMQWTGEQFCSLAFSTHARALCFVVHKIGRRIDYSRLNAWTFISGMKFGARETRKCLSKLCKSTRLMCKKSTAKLGSSSGLYALNERAPAKINPRQMEKTSRPAPFSKLLYRKTENGARR